MNESFLESKMIAYSGKQIYANPPLLYSALSPDTNSDSPSAKSNGFRLVSAKEILSHNKHDIRGKRWQQKWN